MPEQTGPSVDDLQAAFPAVDRDKLTHIRESAQNLTLLSAADILAEAAEMGKVPDTDYHARAAAADDSATFELRADDPLEEPPDPDPTSQHNKQRGDKAMQHLKMTDYETQVKRVSEQGSIEDILNLMSTLNKWGNEALLHPNRTSLPDTVKDSVESLGASANNRVDALAAQGKEAALRDAKETAERIGGGGFADHVVSEVDNKLRLLNNDGDEFEQVREDVLSEDNTPPEVIQKQRAALAGADITYEQATELIREVNEWLEEYHAVSQDVQGTA